MDVARWLECLREDGELLAATARKNLDIAVPTCPGWTVRDAVVHTGEVYAHKIAAIEIGHRPKPGEWPTGPEDGDDPVDWFAATHARLVQDLSTRDADQTTWTWYPPDRTIAFWCRRMAHETAVHRVDVESAHGDVTPVHDDLAVDGVEEVLATFLAYLSKGEKIGGDDQTVVYRTGHRAWRCRLRADGVDLDHQIAPAQATVSGEPSELYLYLWGRRPESAVQVEGDVEAVRALRRWLVQVTQ